MAKGMILAAGQGTRVRPLTKDLPKPMVPILGKPVMEYLIEHLARHGIKEIMVNVAFHHHKIEQYFGDGNRWGVEIGYAYEGVREHGDVIPKPFGSAGGMRRIQDFSGFFDEPTLVLCGDALIDLDFLGIDNVLVLRGDAAKNEKAFEPEPDGNRYAIDLLKQVGNMNNGIYMDEDIKGGGKTKFCMGVAGYPEKHFEAPNLEIDLKRLKEKVDAGAEYIMTQMFFDNKKFFAFVKECRAIGIQVPIIPGLKPITTKKQLSVLPRIFHVDIPTDLSNSIMKCKTDQECEQAGAEWLIQQSKELKAFGVPVLHYYTLGKPKVIWNVVKALQ